MLRAPHSEIHTQHQTAPDERDPNSEVSRLLHALRRAIDENRPEHASLYARSAARLLHARRQFPEFEVVIGHRTKEPDYPEVAVTCPGCGRVHFHNDFELPDARRAHCLGTWHTGGPKPPSYIIVPHPLARVRT